jgi:glucose/arabinose dehydrogenase
MTMSLAKTALVFMLASAAVAAQVNKATRSRTPTCPSRTPVTTFELPWRIAFLPDGRMLVTEKVGLCGCFPAGTKIAPVGNTPPVYWQGQNGMMLASPRYATDQGIYLPYAEPGLRRWPGWPARS